jgi:hypothetical protein
MRAHGWRSWYEPAAVAHHAHSAASSQRFDEQSFAVHMFAATYLWMLRRRGKVQTRATALVGILDACARVAALRLAGLRGRGRVDRRVAGARGAISVHRLGLRSEAWLERRVRRGEEPT